MHRVSCAAFFTVILLFAACSFSFENCRSLNREVRRICPYYNDTTDDDDYLSHLSKDTIIFHFSALFYSKCSTLSRILVCCTLFPFCSPRHSIVLLPCHEVCFSVFTACNHVLTAHRQQWPAFLNCSSFPSPPHLCLQPSHFINQPSSSSSSSSLLSTPTASSSASSLHASLHQSLLQRLLRTVFILLLWRHFFWLFFCSDFSFYVTYFVFNHYRKQTP